MTRRVAAINDCESAFDVDDGGMLLGGSGGRRTTSEFCRTAPIGYAARHPS